MRFSSVEVERAYSDYLDFLKDWPPPAEEGSMGLAATMRASELDEAEKKRTPPPRSMHS